MATLKDMHSEDITLNGQQFGGTNTFSITGINDVFKPFGNNLEDLHMYIFNRWGELIHETYTIDGFWDGTYQGEPCQQDVYVWFLEYKFIGYEFYEEIRGHVTLVR